MLSNSLNKRVVYGCGVFAGMGILFLIKNKILSMLGRNGSHVAKHILKDTEVHLAARDTAISLFNKLLDDVRIKTQTRALISQITTDETIKKSIRDLITHFIEDPRLKLQITALLNELLNNNDIHNTFILFITNIMNNDSIKQSIINILNNPELIRTILNDPELIRTISTKVNELLKNIMADEDLIIKFRIFIVRLLDDDAMKTLLEQHGTYLLSSQMLKDAGRDYLVDVLTSAQVKDNVNKLLSESIMSNLNNEDVQKDVQNKLNNVLSQSMMSDEIQKHGADSLSNIIKTALTPSWWSSSSK